MSGYYTLISFLLFRFLFWFLFPLKPSLLRCCSLLFLFQGSLLLSPAIKKLSHVSTGLVCYGFIWKQLITCTSLTVTKAKMMGLIKFLLSRFGKLTKVSQSAEKCIFPRDKAIAVAQRVSVTTDEKFTRVYCPVCLDVLSSSLTSDIRMVLALHLSLWHPDDVNLLWDIMQNKKKTNVHVPSFVLGLGVGSGFGVLLVASMWKIHSQSLVGKRGR